MPKICRTALAAIIVSALYSPPNLAGITQDVEDALNFYHYGHEWRGQN